jgi:hypothetical protein
MTRVVALIWLATAAVTAWGLFHLKNEVQGLEYRLHEARKATAADREALDILKAEWSFLNQPAEIARLAQKHLGLGPVDPAQVVPLTELAAYLDPQPDSTAPDGGDLPPGAATLASAKAEQ